jgi:phage-related protein
VPLALSFGIAPALAQTQQPANSGFLADYSKLQPAADREGVRSWVNRSVDYRNYSKVVFHPTVVVVMPGPDYKGVQPDALKRMTDAFTASFKGALSPAYQVVNEPGPDVLQVRLAITGVQPVAPGLHPTDLLPIKAVFNIGRAAAGKAPQVAEMSAEMEVLDGSGKPVAAAVATRKGDKSLNQGESITWKHLEAITAYWAGSFRQRLDELRAGGAQ